MKIFGFDISRKNSEAADNSAVSFTQKENTDGAIEVGATAFGGSISPIGFDANLTTESDLINRYRGMLMQPEVSTAVEEIANESISEDAAGVVVKIDLSKVKVSDKIKTRITEEFNSILSLMDFNNEASELFTRWYVDGRLNFHAIAEKGKEKEGLVELRYIDPRKLRLVREMKQVQQEGIETLEVMDEYYVYSPSGFDTSTPFVISAPSLVSGIRIKKDNIIRVTSGLLSEDQSTAISYMHKAIKPLNQLRYLEDAAVIYRLTRAPERRIFYIDVGKLPSQKAEQYLKDMMSRHKAKLVYNQSTGEIRDQKTFMTMTDDFWFTRREGSRGTEVMPLAGGQNLDQIEDILYFQKKLYRALNVPAGRLEADTNFSFGRPTELNRQEQKFGKFVKRLRARFSKIFDDVLRIQLHLRGVMTVDEWDAIKNDVSYIFSSDSFSSEMKDIEITRERINLAKDLEDFVGNYYSRAYVRTNVLRMTEEDYKKIQKEIDAEKKSGEIQTIEPGEGGEGGL